MTIDPTGRPIDIRKTARRRLANGIKHNPKSKVMKNKDGKAVRMVRIRRKRKKKATTEVSTPNSLLGHDRVVLSDEMGQAATPVQAKPNAVGAKKSRYRSVQPGLNHLVKRGHVDPFPRHDPLAPLVATVL